MLRVSTWLLGAGGWASIGAAQERVGPPAEQGGQARLLLSDVLQRAVTQHPLIEAARARVSAARGARRTAGTLPNPVLTYWVESLGGSSGSGIPLDRETQTYATLPLEPLFQRWPRVRGANQVVLAADADLARARQAVALDAARAFYRVAAAQVAVDAAEEIQSRLAELVTFTTARTGEGVTAEADLIRTQLELDRVAATVTLEQVELARARGQLAPYIAGPAAEATVTNRPVAFRSDSLRVGIQDTSSVTESGDLAPLSDYVARARLGRGDLLASRARAAAAAQEVGYQRALTVRQVGATFGTKRTAGVTSYLAGISLPFPLFDQNRGEVQRATGERTASEQELAWAERQAVAEVEAAYQSVQLLGEQMNRLRGSFLNRAEESRRIALAAYQEGAVSLLQVLDASRTLADARLTYYRTLFAQRQSRLELQAAIGAPDLLSSQLPVLTPSRLERPSGDRP